jgi:hypothetical protein
MGPLTPTNEIYRNKYGKAPKLSISNYRVWHKAIRYILLAPSCAEYLSWLGCFRTMQGSNSKLTGFEPNCQLILPSLKSSLNKANR